LGKESLSSWFNSPFSAKAENAANRFGDHAFFFHANDANRNPAGRCGNRTCIRRVSL
jgi:hypothetical protein